MYLNKVLLMNFLSKLECLEVHGNRKYRYCKFILALLIFTCSNVKNLRQREICKSDNRT